MNNLSTDSETPFLMEDFSSVADCGGVVFVDDFDAPPPPPATTAPPAPPPLTAHDLAAAREAGWQEGFAAARTNADLLEGEARSRLAHRLTELISAAAADAIEVARATADATAHEMLRLLSACLPALCDQHGPDEARALAAVLLPLLTPTLATTLRCHPSDIPRLQGLLVAPGTDGPAHSLIADDTLSIGDLRMSWDGGAACRDTRTLLTGLTAAMRPLGIALGPEAPARRGRAPIRHNERESDYV